MPSRCCDGVMMMMMRMWVRRDVDAKRVYYLSMEFLMGRSLLNALNNLGVVDQARLPEAVQSCAANAAKLRDMGAAALSPELQREPSNAPEVFDWPGVHCTSHLPRHHCEGT